MGDFDLHTVVVGREAMACRFEVALNAGEVADGTALAVEALDLVDEIEGKLSVYRDTSELSRLNATAAEGWQPVSHDVFVLLERARAIHDLTAGGFDVAAGAITRAWGFLHRAGRVPEPESLAAARERSGMRLVELDPVGRRVRFTRPGVELNPGAIGKGWAVDRAVERLVAAGVRSGIVHGGQSSVRAWGVHGPTLPGRRGWQVGLRDPLRPTRRLATFTLVDRALGTSGSGTQFFVDRGRRLGHILDPRTGTPAEGVISATVVAATAAEADALATALYVLGPAGLDRIAAADGPVGAVLVLPTETSGGMRIVVANLPDDELAIDAPVGVEVMRRGTAQRRA